MARDVRALLGRRPLGGSVLRGARGERRVALNGPAERLARGPRTDRAGGDPDGLLRRDEPGVGRGLAGLPGPLSRDQRPPQTDAPRLGENRAVAARAGTGPGSGPPLSRPSQPPPPA